ncbi:MAG: aminofutalosine synthase MqnE [Planctomycetota bacterium]
MLKRITPELGGIAAKVEANERLGFEDGLALYRTRDIQTLGELANRVRERRHGNDAYFVVNRHLNPSNICVFTCRFCAFRRAPNEAGAYRMSLDEVRRKVLEEFEGNVTEVHIVGGVDPKLPYRYFIDLVRLIHELRPDIHIKAYTMIEIEWLSRIGRKSVPEVIEELKEAGLGSCPGGGAEVLAERVHRELFDKKLDAQRWLETARAVHAAGLRSNATMLYGHIETEAELVEHMLKVRELQDETGGFLTFIPLAFHPANTRLSHLPGPSGLQDLRAIAVSRLLLDNIDHIKTYWVMQTLPLSQIALRYGADDIDGTVVEEKITHDAGAQTPLGLTREELVAWIREAGRDPVERDTLYTRLTRARPEEASASRTGRG